jgi:hypothetical protein
MTTTKFQKYMRYLECARPPHSFWGETDNPKVLNHLEEGAQFDNSRSQRRNIDINNYDEIIYNFSVPRSGSTLLKQLMSEIFDYDKILYFYKLPRFNLFRPPTNGSPIIMTYRDFRDIILSTRRMRLSMFGICKEESFTTLPTKKELFLLAEREVIPQINGFEFINSKFKDRVLLLKYEDFYSDYDKIFDKFEAFFNSPEDREILKFHGYDGDLRIGEDKREELKSRFSFENNFKKTRLHQNFRSWDKKNKSGLSLHGDHMNSGILEEWKSLPKDLSSYMTEILHPQLKRWGYEK